MVIGWVIGERAAQRVCVAYERASRLERRIEPLVRIDGFNRALKREYGLPPARYRKDRSSSS
jgi:hypothetical protein